MTIAIIVTNLKLMLGYVSRKTWYNVRAVKIGDLTVELFDLPARSYMESPIVDPKVVLNRELRRLNSERIEVALRQQGLDRVPDEQYAAVYSLQNNRILGLCT